MLEKKFHNFFYGECVLLAESKNLYLVYVSKLHNPYIVCTYLDQYGALMGQTFFKEKETACNFYLEKQQEKTNNSRRK